MEAVDLRECTLKKVRIEGNVIGKFGIFEIEQIFKNEKRNLLEVGYTFPIAETATVIGFEVNVEGRILKGKCKEKQTAQKEYIRNMIKGNSAYMMEQENSNVFRISIGKIARDEEVKLKICYIDKFEIIDNTIEILIPTLVTPKYKSKITNKLIYTSVDYTVDFNINIDRTLNISNIHCKNHKIDIVEEKNLEKIQVLNYDMSKDFALSIKLKEEMTSNAVKSKTRDGKEIVHLSFLPEILDTYEDGEKEYIFVIDISGSMMGTKLIQTKKAVIKCLKQLDIGDKFNIIAFESEYKVMNITSIDFNERNMKKAEEYINNLEACGGTEMFNPIKFALYEPNRDKIILLFTDGQVGNEDEIIHYVENHIRHSRIFTFGIDTNVNSSFIKQLSKVGNGKAELIQPQERIDNKIIRTFARIQTPLLENIQIVYGKNRILDEIREDNSLFNYEFYHVFTKIEKLEDDIILKGKILDKEYKWKISKETIHDTNIDLELIFAKLEIERLETYIRNTYDDKRIKKYKDMIVELSEKYNINSKYTSFITVYERKNKLLEVPQYEETPLSNQYQNNRLKDAIIGVFSKDADVEYEEKCDEEYEEDTQLLSPFTTFGNNSNSSYDLDIPCFLRKNNMNKENNPLKQTKNQERKVIEEKVDEYYPKFIMQNQKSILTYLLFALYCLRNHKENFNYYQFLDYLKDNQQYIFLNEEYMQLLYLCYCELETNKIDEKKITFQLLNEKYKKIIYTNLKPEIKLKEVDKLFIKNKVNKNNVENNIDDILYYLLENNN